MNKIWNWLDNGHTKGAYELMTNQIYTAVLGSIIYMLFDWGYKVFNNQITAPDIFIRTMFLVVGIAFYLSDYYYIKGSNPYRKWHFVFDLGFMICMLYSTKLLNVDSQSTELKMLSDKELIGINMSYIIFLILYLAWDIRELIYIWNKQTEQRNYYFEVIIWEVLSLLSLSFIYKKNECYSVTLLIVLVVSTIWFCFLSYRKGEHKCIF